MTNAQQLTKQYGIDVSHTVGKLRRPIDGNDYAVWTADGRLYSTYSSWPEAVAGFITANGLDRTQTLRRIAEVEARFHG